MAGSGFMKVADVGELSPGEMKYVEVGGDQVLLANVEGTIYACDNLCTHAFAPLAEGDLDGEHVECPLHGSVFSVVTGEVNRFGFNNCIENSYSSFSSFRGMDIIISQFFHKFR